jgi:outer membrane protein assembly factor BamB
VVDLLDFPLDPPNAARASGGQDFGVHRSRYNGNHAGEDWRGPGGRRASFGEPVYSIGHGQVTYAAPLGWGVDQGVVIVRHVFADGSTILSFYGHLDPPSVVLRAGDCIGRGEPVGQIGKPRTSPHLHFEIRSHMPNQPGPGYWPVDPTLAGWEAPSQFIWDNRILAAPGVEWTHTFTSGLTSSLGMLADGTLGVLDGSRLVGIDASGGGLRWRQPISFTWSAVTIDVDGGILYTANFLGEVAAWRLPSAADADLPSSDPPTLVSLWRFRHDTRGLPALMPLPGGGVAVAVREQMLGLSAAGRLLWRQEGIGQPLDWIIAGEQLIFTPEGRVGPVVSVDATGPAIWEAPISGRLASAGERIYVYGVDGIYRLNAENRAAERLYTLPYAAPNAGDVVALPGGGLLVAHQDAHDSRLIALHEDGTLRWERSYADLLPGRQRQRLLMLGDRPFLVSQAYGSFAADEVSVFTIDVENAALVRIFNGGTRTPTRLQEPALALGRDRILVSIGGSYVVALDTRRALGAVVGARGSR